VTTIPYISLKDLEIDTMLARLLPRRLAYYHVAVPLAADGDQISVAIARADAPTNPAVIDMFETLLGASIVLVYADPVEIRGVLDRVWQAVQRPTPTILTWGSSEQRANTAFDIGNALGQVFSARVTNAWGDDLEALALLTQHDLYMLTIVSAPISPELLALVRKAGTPLLLLSGARSSYSLASFSRILLSLRGHSPDLSALTLTIPLASASDSEVTALSVSGDSTIGISSRFLASLLDPDQEPAQHLLQCADQLVQAGIRGNLKLCQGNPIQQIASEFSQGQYGVLIITSEAYGDFVVEVIQTLDAESPDFAVLIVKPTM